MCGLHLPRSYKTNIANRTERLKNQKTGIERVTDFYLQSEGTFRNENTKTILEQSGKRGQKGKNNTTGEKKGKK